MGACLMQSIIGYCPISLALLEHFFFSHTHIPMHTYTQGCEYRKSARWNVRFYEGIKPFKGEFILGQSGSNA